MRKLLPLALLFLLSSCSLLWVNRPVRDRVYEARMRKEDEQVKRSIPLTVVIRADCKHVKPEDPREHWQWLGWRRGWRRMPNEIVIMCATPEQYRKVFAPVEGAECHP